MIESESVVQPAAQARPEKSAPRAKARPARILLYLVLLCVIVVYITPILGVVLTSFKQNAEISMEGLWSLPHALRLDN
jgi:ABC-type glycerol-3-phosphate transport system permease component